MNQESAQYIEVILGEYEGARGYIERVRKGQPKPYECVIYKKNNPTPFKRCFIRDEIFFIIPKIPRLKA